MLLDDFFPITLMGRAMIIADLFAQFELSPKVVVLDEQLESARKSNQGSKR